MTNCLMIDTVGDLICTCGRVFIHDQDSPDWQSVVAMIEKHMRLMHGEIRGKIVDPATVENPPY